MRQWILNCGPGSRCFPVEAPLFALPLQGSQSCEPGPSNATGPRPKPGPRSTCVYCVLDIHEPARFAEANVTQAYDAETVHERGELPSMGVLIVVLVGWALAVTR
jgi:hypothetical protein